MLSTVQSWRKKMHAGRGENELSLLQGDSFQRAQNAGIVCARFQQTQYRQDLTVHFRQPISRDFFPRGPEDTVQLFFFQGLLNGHEVVGNSTLSLS